MKRLIDGAAAALVVAGVVLSGAAQAASVSWTASGTPAGLAATATATFSWSSSSPSKLTIDLTASGGGAGAFGAGSALTGLFFDLGSNTLALTPASATITAGSSIVNAASCNPGPCAGVTNVGGEWGYQNSPGGFSGGPSASYGIAAAGYLTTGLPNDIGNFNNGAAGTNLDDPVSIDGGNFGLLPSGVNLNGGLATTPVVEKQIEFVLTGLPSGFSLSNIKDVSFQYGTAFSETNLRGSDASDAPEPATIALLGVGLLGLGYIRRRQS